ncbi:MAG: hypothetical protein RR233_08365 [Clostridiales bacterium]
MSVVFENNSIAVEKALGEAGLAWLYEASGEICSQTQRNTKVSGGGLGGKTKGSWRVNVDEKNMTAIVGSNSENAIWEEFGTGEYALEGKGRKGGWWIKVGGRHGEMPLSTVQKYGWAKVRKDNDGNITFVFTLGKRPRRAFQKAYLKTKPKVLRRANEIFKGVGD